MSFKSTITVEFGDKAGLTDVSSSILGAKIDCYVDVADLGTNRAIISIDNNDGAFTPGAGGTYSSVDWFSQGLFISGDTGSYTFEAFHGLITDFQLGDDGTNSYVTIVADDSLTIGGASRTEVDVTGSTGHPLWSWIDYVYDGYNDTNIAITGVQMPLLGNTTAGVGSSPVGIATGLVGTSLATSSYTETAPARDFVRTVLMPQSFNVAWPTTIDLSTTNTLHKLSSCNVYPVRSSSTAITFTFDEAAAAGELPFARIERGFAVDSMINQAIITCIEDSAGNINTGTAVNTVSQQKHGTRTYSASSAMIGSPPADNEYLGLTAIVDRWANVFADSEFTVQAFTLSERLVDSVVGSSATSEEKWAQLLDITTGPVQLATIAFTPTGSNTQVTEAVVIMSRSIDMTPSDITIRIECLPADRTGAFVLDSSTLGVLDTNRLG